MRCNDNEDLEIVKVRLAEAINQNVSNIQLHNSDGMILDDEKTISDQHLFDDDVIYFVLKVSDGNNDENNTDAQWEDINVIPYDQDTSGNSGSSGSSASDTNASESDSKQN